MSASTCRALLLICLLTSSSAHATRTVRVYDVIVPRSDASQAASEAVRVALVRATGNRNAAADPALAAIVADASRYVVAIRPAAGGAQEVSLDGPGIDRAIQSAGQFLWPRERPLTLIVLEGAQPATDSELTRRSVEAIANARGLPVAVVPANTLGVAIAGEPSRELLLPAARRLGADAVLVGRQTGANVSELWQWSLVSEGTSESWTGALDAGIDGAVDAFTRAADDAATAPPELDALVAITGVASLRDFAAVSQALARVPGLKRVGLEEASGDTAIFRVAVGGGAEAVGSALESQGRFQRGGPIGAAAVSLVFRP